MKPNHCHTFILILGLFLLYSCQSNRPSKEPSACKTSGEVKDFTGTDGCKLLIITEDGKKLLPGRILESRIELKAGQKIRFDYRPLDMMSICMAEDLIVEITCLEVESEK